MTASSDLLAIAQQLRALSGEYTGNTVVTAGRFLREAISLGFLGGVEYLELRFLIEQIDAFVAKSDNLRLEYRYRWLFRVAAEWLDANREKLPLQPPPAFCCDWEDHINPSVAYVETNAAAIADLIEAEAVGKPTDPAIEQGGKPAPSSEPTDNTASDEGETVSMEAMALATLADHPEWSDTQIAKAVGCSRTSLYRWPKFVKSQEILKAGKDTMPHGEKTADGDFEAWK